MRASLLGRRAANVHAPTLRRLLSTASETPNQAGHKKTFPYWTIAVSGAGGFGIGLGYFWYQGKQRQEKEAEKEKEWNHLYEEDVTRDAAIIVKSLTQFERRGVIGGTPPKEEKSLQTALAGSAFSAPPALAVEYHASAFQVNQPFEDNMDVHWSPFGFIFGMFDGHSGPGASLYAKSSVASFVEQAVGRALDQAKEGKLDPQGRRSLVTAALIRAFEECDSCFFMDRQLDSNVARHIEMVSGACTNVAFVDPASRDLYVANAGDCRAILGRVNHHGKWEAIQLSTDHQAGDPAETKRLRDAHPDEADVVKRGRVKGRLEPSRGLGDGVYKHRSIADWMRPVKKLPESWNPPYTTATPEVTCHHLEEGDRFIVLATDGLWWKFSNEEVVGMVVKAREESKNVRKADLVKGADPADKDKDTFVTQRSTENVASSVVRETVKAAGLSVCRGSDKAQSSVTHGVGHVLSFFAPRRICDDTSVMVVFFGEKDSFSVPTTDLEGNPLTKHADDVVECAGPNVRDPEVQMRVYEKMLQKKGEREGTGVADAGKVAAAKAGS